MSEVYRPSKLGSYLALQGGKKYVAGVAILHAPEETIPFHLRDISTEPEKVADKAGKLIKAGLIDVIRHALPEGLSMLSMKTQFKTALPNMLATNEALYADDADAARIFPEIAYLQPMPVLKETPYKNLCHGRLGTPKLTLTNLMGGVAIDPRLEPFCHARSETPMQPDVASMDQPLPGTGPEDIALLASISFSSTRI